MWDEDWARLDIERTTQLAAIKKAYAVKLKVTRPDDDAQAYQALRAAYERAQQWAAWARAEAEQGREVPMPAGPAADAPDAPVALTPEPAAPPVDVPAKIASSRASRRAVASASSVDTVSMPLAFRFAQTS